MPNIDFKAAAVGAGLVFIGMKGFSKNKTADAALIAVGAVILAKQAPVLGKMV